MEANENSAVSNPTEKSWRDVPSSEPIWRQTRQDPFPSAPELQHVYEASLRRQRETNGAALGTIEAFIYELREYGLAQLGNPNCLRRLADLSTEQLRDVIGRLMKLKPGYPTTITDQLLLKLGEQL
jgi:hypothetical protein